MTYNPQRPRPAVLDDAPVDALLEPATEHVAAESDDVVVDLTTPGVGTSPTPVVPAPTEGTANRAVVAALAALTVALVALVVVLRRRR
ncbi:MAG: hypothetical protein ACKOYM_04535 [Actinomycetes bacterium]